MILYYTYLSFKIKHVSFSIWPHVVVNKLNKSCIILIMWCFMLIMLPFFAIFRLLTQGKSPYNGVMKYSLVYIIMRTFQWPII